MDEKELAEYVIKRILDGDVFFAANPDVISHLEKELPLKYEDTGLQVKLRGYKDLYELYFIKKDEKFRSYSSVMVKAAGGNFETLLGFILEDVLRTIHVHVYYTGSKFDLDKMSEMVYSLFTEIGKDCIRKTKEAIII